MVAEEDSVCFAQAMPDVLDPILIRLQQEPYVITVHFILFNMEDTELASQHTV